MPKLKLSTGVVLAALVAVLAVTPLAVARTQASTSTTVNFGQTAVSNSFVQPGFRFSGGKGTSLQGLTLGLEYHF